MTPTPRSLRPGDGQGSIVPLKWIEYGFGYINKIPIYPIFYLLMGDCWSRIAWIICKDARSLFEGVIQLLTLHQTSMNASRVEACLTGAEAFVRPFFWASIFVFGRLGFRV